MKTCSKCGRSYPDHVDFCLRDGHPLVAQESPKTEAEAPPEEALEVKGRGGVPIDLQATTDVFLPNLGASLLGGEDGDGATTAPDDDAHATEEIEPITSSPEGEAASKADAPVDPNADLLATDIISVSRVRKVMANKKEGQPISLISPKAMDPESMKQTELIPRNWRGQLEEAGQLPAEMTTTDPKGSKAEVTVPGAALSMPSEAPEAESVEITDTDPKGVDGAKTSEDPVESPSEEIEALRKTGSVSRAAMSMPFVFDGDGESLDGIPSGFEDSAPPEDGDVENTGLLSRSFIQRTIQESAEATAPWEDGEKEEQPFVPRGERGEGVPALEEGELHKGIAPPKGSFRKRAAFSHWPSTAGEESEPEEEELAELGPASIETGEMKAPPPARAPAMDPWSEAAASSTTMTQAAQAAPRAEPVHEQAPPSRGWMWAALAVLVIGVGAVLGLSMNKSGTEIDEAPVQVGSAGSSALKVAGGNQPKAAPKAPAIDISKSAPIPQEGEKATAGEAPEGVSIAAVPEPGGSKATAGPTEDNPRPAAETAKATPKQSPKVAAAPKVGTLKIQVDPPGAQISIDGAVKGESPRTVKLPAGRHTLRVEKSGYEPSEQQVNIKAGGADQVKVSLRAIPRATPRPTKMRVIITSNVQGAEVFVDGKSVGKTPATAQIRQGSRKIKVVVAGKDPYVQTLDVPRTTDPSSFKRVHAQF